ncbi:TPA: DUF7370 family protein, partial [Pasteurella multocida]
IKGRKPREKRVNNMAELKTKDIHEFIGELGYSVPNAVLSLIIERVEKKDSELNNAGYDDTTLSLIKLYSIALLVISQGGRKLSSQGAPSGASRSFTYDQDSFKRLKSLLANLDKSGVMNDLPIASSSVGFFEVVG